MGCKLLYNQSEMSAIDYAIYYKFPEAALAMVTHEERFVQIPYFYDIGFNTNWKNMADWRKNYQLFLGSVSAICTCNTSFLEV